MELEQELFPLVTFLNILFCIADVQFLLIDKAQEEISLAPNNLLLFWKCRVWDGRLKRVGAPLLANRKLEVIPTGYILIESGNITTVQNVSKTLPIAADNFEHAAATDE